MELCGLDHGTEKDDPSPSKLLFVSSAEVNISPRRAIPQTLASCQSPLSSEPLQHFSLSFDFFESVSLLTTSPLCLVNLYLFSQNHPQRFTRGITSFGNILGPLWPRLLQ